MSPEYIFCGLTPFFFYQISQFGLGQVMTEGLAEIAHGQVQGKATVDLPGVGRTILSITFYDQVSLFEKGQGEGIDILSLNRCLQLDKLEKVLRKWLT